MREANGVDIWLAPGGTLDVNSPEEGGTECFLDCDEEAHYRLGEIVQKLGGPFNPHRSEGTFKPPLEPGEDWAVWLVYEVSMDGGVTVEEPITGTYATEEAAVAEVKNRLGEDATPYERDELRVFYKAQPSLDVVIMKMIVS